MYSPISPGTPCPLLINHIKNRPSLPVFGIFYLLLTIIKVLYKQHFLYPLKKRFLLIFTLLSDSQQKKTFLYMFCNVCQKVWKNICYFQSLFLYNIFVWNDWIEYKKTEFWNHKKFCYILFSYEIYFFHSFSVLFLNLIFLFIFWTKFHYKRK